MLTHINSNILICLRLLAAVFPEHDDERVKPLEADLLQSQSDPDQWKAERQDVMSSRPVTLPTPPTHICPRPCPPTVPQTLSPPLFLSTSLLSYFFCCSKSWLCYVHQFFLCNYKTVQSNQIETTRRRTLCKQSEWGRADTLVVTCYIFTSCIFSWEKRNGETSLYIG